TATTSNPTASHDAEPDLTHSSSCSGSEEDLQRPNKLQRPKVGSRKTSRTLIIPRDSPYVEVVGEDEIDDAERRAMSPRRSSEECEKLGQEARQALIEQAKTLQANLLDIVDKVESVRSEHEKLEGGNRFLQSYIGELMQTSKITSTGAYKSKGKGRNAK
ncbi:hypothetical protein K402DRAFT_306223, partial [Aulographum hederae CBS 113979]